MENNSENDVKAPDPFDPARFAVKDTAEVGFGVQKVLVMLTVRKPGKQEFFRAHPELSIIAPLLELEGERGEVYLILPEIAAQMPGEWKLKKLTLCVSRQGNWFLWPIPVTPADGRDNPWHTSAREAAKLALHCWVRMIPNQSAGMYDTHIAKECVSEPSCCGWPSEAAR